MASCQFITSPDEPVPTVSGLLTLGLSPQDYLPDSAVQFLRIDGNELADPVLDEQLITGTIPEILRKTEEKLMAHNRTAVDITSSPVHKRSMPYPPAAFQQILYNAVLHRSYERTNAPVRVYRFSDRIEISSPGGPFGNVTAENFGNPGITDYRNPNMAVVLKNYGYIQAFGRGLAVAEKALKDNGNPPLEFDVNPSAVVCTFKRPL